MEKGIDVADLKILDGSFLVMVGCYWFCAYFFHLCNDSPDHSPLVNVLIPTLCT